MFLPVPTCTSQAAIHTAETKIFLFLVWLRNRILQSCLIGHYENVAHQQQTAKTVIMTQMTSRQWVLQNRLIVKNSIQAREGIYSSCTCTFNIQQLWYNFNLHTIFLLFFYFTETDWNEDSILFNQPTSSLNMVFHAFYYAPVCNGSIVE
jgi:hypothetical protein